MLVSGWETGPRGPSDPALWPAGRPTDALNSSLLPIHIMIFQFCQTVSLISQAAAIYHTSSGGQTALGAFLELFTATSHRAKPHSSCSSV